MYVDEVAIGWNGWNILKTGRDEFGTYLPLWFKSFGDYKLPVYIYTVALSMSVFGKTAFAVRLPAVLASTGSIIIFVLLTKLVTKSSRFSLLCGLLLTISPWHLQFGRAGFEATLARFLTLLGLYLILLNIKTRRKTFFLGSAALVMSLYTYHFSRILSPLLFLSLVIIYFPQVKSIFKARFAINAGILLLILCIPFMMYVFSSSGMARARSESFIRDLPKELKNNPLGGDIWSFEQVSRNYLTYFSIDFLFFTGDGIGRHSLREFGMNFLWQLPFYVYGLYISIKKRRELDQVFLVWFLLSPIAAAFATPSPHALRALPGVVAVTYFIAVGLESVWKRYAAHQTIVHGTICLFLGYFMLLYLHIYYVHYPQRTGPDWTDGYKETFDYVRDHEAQYDLVQISPEVFQSEIYLFFYGNFDPNETQIVEARDQDSYGKYIFSSRYHPKTDKKILYIGNYLETTDLHELITINNRHHDGVTKIWEN
jgi:4-amino-4-deoxy-L-arabinose transferase-like glycosyltransferase